MSDPDDSLLPIVRDHRRQWRQCRYVYPVISRRSGGLSIGVNLNPDKQCSFACVYCQVNRLTRRGFHEVEPETIRQELRLALEAAFSGQLWQEERFKDTPSHLRRVNDIALSGDGEPTIAADFDLVAGVVAQTRREFPAAADMKLVLITNASMLDQPQVQRGLAILDANNGEVWAKLDAGTEEYFGKVNHPYPRITLAHILKNILTAATSRPIVIQSLFLQLDGTAMPEQELDAYCRNLQSLLDSGAKIKLIQAHTIARPPASPVASAIGNAALDAIANRIRQAAGHVPVETYYGG